MKYDLLVRNKAQSSKESYVEKQAEKPITNYKAEFR
jgi:hypothetical protein